MKQISVTELNKLLLSSEANPILLDVREDWEYEICHLANSIHIPMGDVANALEQLDPKQTIVVICHHGMRSMQVAQYLETVGYDDVINLSGGIDAWAREIDSSVPVY